jgi:CheW-like domain
MGTSSELAYGGLSGAPCSPGGEPEWHPTDTTFVSERAAIPSVEPRNAGPSLSPFSRRRASEPSPRKPAPAPDKEATMPETQLFQNLADCEQELATIADRLGDHGLHDCSRRLSLLIAETRSVLKNPPKPKVGIAPLAAPSPQPERVIFVRVGRHEFGLLEQSVGEVQKLSAEEAKRHIENAFGARVYRGPEHLLPLINLGEVLGEPASPERAEIEFVTGQFGEQPFGLVVDEVLGTEEAPVSPMHSVLRKIGLYQGATQRPGGPAVLLVDVAGVATKGGMARLSMVPSALIADAEPMS